MKLRYLMLLVAAGLVAVSMLNGGASARPDTSQWRGWCGGPASTPAQLLARFHQMGVADDIAWRFGVRSVDDSLSNWMHRNIGNALVARTVVLGNEGCRSGSFFRANPRVLHPGDRVFIITRSLVAKFGEGNFSLTPRQGWKRVVLCVHAFANPTCANPLHGKVCVFVWIRPAPKPKPSPAPKPGKVKIVIRKQAFSAADEEQMIFPTPTNVFRFKVQCGKAGKPRYIVYQNDPQPAGTCPVSAGRVLIWELDTLGPDRWQHKSPSYQTFKLKGKKRVLAVFKNKQVKPAPKPQPPPPPPPPAAPPPQPPPPPPPPPPAPPVTYQPWCNGQRTENKSNTEIRWTGGWTSSDGRTASTVSETVDYPWQYNTNVSRVLLIVFPNGQSSSCQATAMTGPRPFEP